MKAFKSKAWLTKKNDIYYTQNDKVIIANMKYIISKSKNRILKIYSIEKRIFNTIKYNSLSFIIKMNPIIENIFLLADENVCKLYEIIIENGNKLECIEKIRVNGHTKNIELAEFSITDITIFATYSTDKTIKIWKKDSPFCICNIPINNPVSSIKIYNDYIFYFDEEAYIITKYCFNKFEIENEFIVNTNEFIILNENKIYLIYHDSISSIDNNNNISTILKFKEPSTSIFYDGNLDILYIFFPFTIDIYKSKNMNLILTQKIDGFKKNIFFVNILNGIYLCANFIILLNDRIEFYNFYSCFDYRQKEDLKAKINYWENYVPNISDIENLEWKANCKEHTNYKLYLNDNEIKKELELNYSKSLTDRKKEVENELKVNKIDKYEEIQLIKMLIKDNTNKELVTKYLNYLKKKEKNDNKIENNYEKEYEYFKIIFSRQELRARCFKIKDFSQKDVFLNLLKRISLLKDKDIDANNTVIDGFKGEVSKIMESIKLFNQPINLSNNELYWYRNTFVIYYALNEILKNKNKIKLMKKSIKEITDRNVFEEDYIIQNKELLFCILMLLVKPPTLELLQYNLNLIQTKDPKYNYKDELNKYNFKKYPDPNIKSYVLILNNKLHILEDPNLYCIKNFVLNINGKMNLEEIELKNYKSMSKSFDQIINFEKMKKFLAKIFCSKVIREAFDHLYPEHYKFPFKDEKEALNFLNEYYYFIPFKSEGAHGVTEKFFLEIYYILKVRKIYFSGNYSDKVIELFKKILYRGSVVKTSCHEINHDFYNIFLKKSNGMIPIETPRKKFINEREGGKNMERILFNQTIRKLSLVESLFLLNEKNYENSLIDFRRKFNELKIEDITFTEDNIFKEFNDVLHINNILVEGKKINIKCDEDDEQNIFEDVFIDDIEDVNDVLGFIREPSKP